MLNPISKVCFVLSVCLISFFEGLALCGAGEILIADRNQNNVYRYNSVTGAFIAPLIAAPDTTLLSEASGLVVSPDLSKLFVTSRLNDRVVQYDYNYALGTATNPVVFADSMDGLAQPNTVRFAGNTLLVANLGGGVVQLNLDGSSAGPVLTGGASGQSSGLAIAPNGNLLVGGFFDNTFSGGTISQATSPFTSLSTLVATNPGISGASGLLVNGNDLYVAGLFAGTVLRFNATTGAFDGTFGITSLPYPQDLMADPNGGGMLVGILGDPGALPPEASRVALYGFNGAFQGNFITAGGGGFNEATAMTYVVPEPASACLVAIAFGAGILIRRRLTR